MIYVFFCRDRRELVPTKQRVGVSARSPRAPLRWSSYPKKPLSVPDGSVGVAGSGFCHFAFEAKVTPVIYGYLRLLRVVGDL